MINLIWAQGKNGELGLNNRLPWYLPADLKHFKDITYGGLVVMGRKTYKSIGKPLPGRVNVVLTRDPEPVWAHPNVWVYDSVCKILNDVKGRPVHVIGGKEIYEAFMRHADALQITKIHEQFDHDTLAPYIDPTQWELEDAKEGIIDVNNVLPHTFETYRRI